MITSKCALAVSLACLGFAIFTSSSARVGPLGSNSLFSIRGGQDNCWKFKPNPPNTLQKCSAAVAQSQCSDYECDQSQYCWDPSSVYSFVAAIKTVPELEGVWHPEEGKPNMDNLKWCSTLTQCKIAQECDPQVIEGQTKYFCAADPAQDFDNKVLYKGLDVLANPCVGPPAEYAWRDRYPRLEEVALANGVGRHPLTEGLRRTK
jgi:hypothetical protein